LLACLPYQLAALLACLPSWPACLACLLALLDCLPCAIKLFTALTIAQTHPYTVLNYLMYKVKNKTTTI
jgi:hypothetical protein